MQGKVLSQEAALRSLGGWGTVSCQEGGEGLDQEGHSTGTTGLASNYKGYVTTAHPSREALERRRATGHPASAVSLGRVRD